MQKNDARKGMKVVISRGGPRAARAAAVIERCGPTRAKVKTTERFNSNPPGSVFLVHYELMEPLPADGDTSKVTFNGGNGDTKIVVGETTFRAVYADSNALWKVIRKEGRNYRCAIENEPIEIDGKTYDSDYAGTQKIFSPEEVHAAVGMANFWQGLANQHDAFYASLKPGQIVHYQNGFDNWVRCEAVNDNGENKLKPVALVGEWQAHDLPRRTNDGSVYNGHYPDMILKGELFKPNVSNLFESGSKGAKARNGVDPRKLKPIDLSVSDITTDEKRVARLWQMVQQIHKITNQHDGDPQDILDAVAAQLKRK